MSGTIGPSTLYGICSTIPDSRGELCGCEHHVTMVLPPVRCQDSTAAHTQNYHYVDREDNFFPFAGSRGCQSGSSTFRDVARPVVVVLRHSAVGFMLMRNSHSPSDRRRRPGVFMRPIWRNNGSTQVTAVTDQVSIDTHRRRAFYLPSFVSDFYCGRAGRVSSVPIALSIVS